jgi:hypothetical protein
MPVEFREYVIEVATIEFVKDERADPPGTQAQAAQERYNKSSGGLSEVALTFRRWVTNTLKYKYIDNLNRELQSQGFPCNTDIQTIAINGSGNILIPADALSIKSTDPYEYYTLRAGMVYDMENRTSVFTESKELEIVHLLPFATMPVEFKNYVLEKANREFLIDERGDYIGQALHSKAAQKESEASLTFKRWVTNNLQANINDSNRNQLLLQRNQRIYSRGMTKYHS